MPKKCSFPSCQNNSFGKDKKTKKTFCLNHQYLRTDLKRNFVKAKTPFKHKKKATGEKALFEELINNLDHISFLSGLDIDREDGQTDHNNCHHVLNKNQYSKFRLYKKNIIFITRFEHNLIHFETQEQRKKYAQIQNFDWNKLELLRAELLAEYKLICF